VAAGIGSAGKFERYFALFRTRALPLVHRRRLVDALLRGGSARERTLFYERDWNNWRWRLLFRVFFSRFLMSRLGRDPSFFAYVEGNVAERIMQRARHAATILNPADNPYLQWLLTGRHLTALPFALRPEYFEAIRSRLDRVEWHCQPLEDFLPTQPRAGIARFNLSDIFEYMSPDNTRRLLEKVANSGRTAGRLAYWNTLVPRSRPDELAHRLRPLTDLAERLHRADKAFFYTRFVVEEIV
jgi:S-adenosylmethionine-diacylglycerol 3-amino-3-carboxypropyl transferase